ncbi:hypothetical protein RRF57_011151 [Xylaria bambusicola]|uniref:Uncharacterized protein n=1 Tax=Xylaria bambusicola TaxID=326684 RepID=A0AAN7UW56_9PEZI
MPSWVNCSGGGRDPTVPKVPTDEVYLLYWMDQLAAGLESVLSETLRYNQVLDPNKLHDGLIRLIQHGDWRKIGGRLRLRPDGTVEVHVPKEFTKDRPAVQFTSQKYDIPIEDHRIGSQLPKLGKASSSQPGPKSFDQFNPIEDVPETLKDYIHCDRPILRLHVTSFTNSTLVTLVWPHVIAGDLGIKEIIGAWSKALHGDEERPALLGTYEDVLKDAGAGEDEKIPYHLEGTEIKGWGFIKLVFNLVWSVFMNPTVESRSMCLPREFVVQLRETCMQELRLNYDGPDKSFLSEGDVIEAWGSRFVGQARGGERSGLIITSLDVQSRLTAPWRTDGVYVQNTAGCVFTSIPPDYLLRKPLGELAHLIRKSIHTAATDEQMRAQLRIFRTLGHTKSIPLYGDPNCHLMSCSNWTKFGIINAADSTPAIVPNTPSRSDGVTPVGKPAYLHCQALGKNKLLRNCFNVTGKDWDGNYWITVFFYPEDWAKLESYMEETVQRIKDTKMPF